MSVTTIPSPTVPEEMPTESIWRFTVDEYHAMIRSGILPSDAPVELLQGLLVKKMTKFPPHSVSTLCTSDALTRIIGSGWHIRNQEPVTTDASQPEPDLAVVRGTPRDYRDRHPGPDEVGMVVEVADSSLERDRDWKQRIYSSAGIPVYWLVNLIDRQVEVFTQQAGTSGQPTYASRQVFRPGEELSVVLEGTEVGRTAVNDLLP